METSLFNNVYNPDVLSCIANLSNDEVFTPPELANKIIDMLPQELFKNPDTTFLDPCCKSGVFLREIAKRLIKGLEHQIPDLEKRIEHIFSKQLFGIAITELTSLLSRRSVYCSKYPSSEWSAYQFQEDKPQGNIIFQRIKHTWKDCKCIYCGASKSEYDRGGELETHAYQFIHNLDVKKVFNMKFDVIIGNPPYQLSDGGSGTGISAKPLYHLFVETAKKLSPRYISMIIPSRWFAGGKGLNEFRSMMLESKNISTMVDYPKSRDCFPGVDIAGGVCYFLWDSMYSGKCKLVSRQGHSEITRDRNLNEFSIFIRDNIGIDIIHKVLESSKDYMDSVVYSRNPFGFVSSDRGNKTEFHGAVKLHSSDGVGYVTRQAILKNADLLDNYKVIIGKVNPDRGGVNNASDGKMNVITKVRILEPNEVMTETYLLLATFKDKTQAENCASYYRTKFARLLISLTLSSMNITKDNFQFVPNQDFSKPWTDAELYAKYGLDDKEIIFIESMIRPME